MMIKINKTKRIGKVVYLVEGDVDEVELIKHVFNKVFGYVVVSYDKRDNSVTKLSAPNDPYSTIYVAPMRYPQIKHLSNSSSPSYIDNVYSCLKSYGLEADESARYFLFDRDCESNVQIDVRNAINVFRNSLDNGSEMQGLLLLSYPCLQSIFWMISDSKIEYGHSYKLKDKTNELFCMDNIDESSLIDITINVLKRVGYMLGRQFDIDDLVDMASVNNGIFAFEENRYHKLRKYTLLSLFVISLIDLGVIDVEN